MLITIVNEDVYFHSKGAMETTLNCIVSLLKFITHIFFAHIYSSYKEAAFTKKCTVPMYI